MAVFGWPDMHTKIRFHTVVIDCETRSYVIINASVLPLTLPLSMPQAILMEVTLVFTIIR
jgi:hypothetical protein